jgi:hypothetical protein
MDQNSPKKPQKPLVVHFIPESDKSFLPLPDFPRTKSLKDLLGTRSWEDLEALPLTEAKKS